MVVVIPVDADVNKAENVAQKHRNRRAKRFKRGSSRHPEIQDHDCNNDGEDAVAESFKPPFIHRGRSVSPADL
jgi:hypothetical protein